MMTVAELRDLLARYPDSAMVVCSGEHTPGYLWIEQPGLPDEHLIK